jgi:glycyl-tRNA synthetase
MREFEQMEMQFFVPPGEELKWYDYWKTQREKWHKNLNLGEDLHRFHDHIKLAHYANAACDIEFDFPMGFKELEGIHSRTDFDLKQHEKHSGKKLGYFDPERNESYVPYVIETSIGLDRMFLAVLSASFTKEHLENNASRTVLKIPAPLAPVKVAILPLVKKDGLPELADKLANKLKFDYNFQIDIKDSIGKRYRRQDAIGTPICITIDHQTKEDNTVTIRFRDSMKQERVTMDHIEMILNEQLGWKNLLTNLA